MSAMYVGLRLGSVVGNVKILAYFGLEEGPGAEY